MIRFLALAILLAGSTASAQFFPFPFPGYGEPDTSNKPQITAAKLPALNGDAKAVTVSGVSAGAFVATQLQVAYSASLAGVGSIAGGPWNCAEGSVMTAQTTCMAVTSGVDPKSLIKELKAAADQGQVDPLVNLKRARVYIYNSKSDQVIREPMNKKTHEFFSAFVDEANIKTETSIKSAHGFPTLDFGMACGTQGTPWLNNCKFDAAGELLQQLSPDKVAAKTFVRAAADPASLVTFDQVEFGGDSVMFADQGYAYVPSACRAAGAKCAVHVALHGCLQASEAVQDQFVTHAGYNEWAEGSKIIVLYPQAKSGDGNPNGCFDWWGYTGDDYANREGAQMKAIKAMIDRVLGS